MSHSTAGGRCSQIRTFHQPRMQRANFEAEATEILEHSIDFNIKMQTFADILRHTVSSLKMLFTDAV